MIRYQRAIPTLLIAVCILLSKGTRCLAQETSSHKWETVKYNGMDYVTIRSVKSFYGFEKIKYGAVITMENAKVKMEVRPKTQRCRMNGVLFILSEPVVAYNGRYLLSRTDLVKLVDPVLRPTYIRGARPFKTVVIDAGHGGKDPGSLGPYENEKVYTLKVAQLVRDMLQQRGYQVVMTRNSDVFISLANRVRIANKYPGAIFLSIHFNAGNSLANGIETFTISPVGVPHMGRGIRPRDYEMVPGNTMDSASIALATAVHSRSLLYLNNKSYGNNFRIEDRGIKRARYNVLTGIRIPAILLEGGFLTNRTEASKVNSSAYQKTLASAIVRAVDVYRDSISASDTP